MWEPFLSNVILAIAEICQIWHILSYDVLEHS